MTESFIGQDEVLALWTVLIAMSAIGLWSESAAWARKVSGVVVTIFAAMAASNFGVIPTSAPVYDAVWAYLVPLAIPLLLLKADLRRVIPQTGKTLIVFAVGSLGTVVGVVIAFSLIDLGANAASLAGIFTGTYIGGSLNFASVATALGYTSLTDLSAAAAADNIVGTVYLAALVTFPAILWLRRKYPSRVIAKSGTNITSGRESSRNFPVLRLRDIVTILTISGVICLAGNSLAAVFGIGSYSILLITALSLIVANSFPSLLRRLSGDFEIGMLFMYLFFATIGASSDVGLLIGTAPKLALFATVVVVTHMIVLLAAGALFKFDLAEMLIASNACILGPATAAAMAGEEGWRDLVAPGVLCGVVGYATGSFVGVGIAGLLS